MKMRTEFVTNSSSASFVLALKDDFTDEQKIRLADFVIQAALGDKVEGEDAIQEVKEAMWRGEDKVDGAVANGQDIYQGWIDFECCEYGYADFMQKLWRKMEEVSDGNFTQIDTSLDY